MSHRPQKITAVPTNIITGFLGVGKTSAIMHLLANKPKNERWAVLVNEFGEIGVDGSLIKGQHTAEQNVFVREVPGGCMCCAAGLPMKVALNQLLNQAQPDRLLIEPTGLGHPKEVLQVLSGDYYREILSIHKTLTLVDARKLSDARYTQHETFNQQIAIADIVVGNKVDLYVESDKLALENYVKKHACVSAELVFTQHGALAMQWLYGSPTKSVVSDGHDHTSTESESIGDKPLPACGYVKAINKGEGFYSVGWRFVISKRFHYDKLYALLNELKVERAKAIFITDAGNFAYNLTSDGLVESSVNDCTESRIEIISSEVSNEWEAQLLECIIGDVE